MIQIRKYDLVPDVMVYTTRFEPKFPNGRQLLDDVAALTCQVGDCILQELSFIEGGWPRALVNDKPFLADWPYVAEPYPDQPAMPQSTKSIWPYLIGLAVVIVVLGWLIVEISSPPADVVVSPQTRESRSMNEPMERGGHPDFGVFR